MKWNKDYNFLIMINCLIIGAILMKKKETNWAMIFLQGRWYWKGKICETNIVGFGGTRLIIYFPLSDLSNDVIRKIDVTSLHLVIGIWNVEFNDWKSEKCHILI